MPPKEVPGLSRKTSAESTPIVSRQGYTLISGATAFLVGSIVGAWFGGVPGITIGGILATWIVIFLLRRNEKHDDPSTE